MAKKFNNTGRGADFLYSLGESWFDVGGGGHEVPTNARRGIRSAKHFRTCEKTLQDARRKKNGTYPTKISLAPVRLKEVKGDG